mmetsp:Transcript_62726/g.123234  ORF Transcript_62726/g.123234 Transcript_62726/m.123234 type:complete len:127 (+) Transcript_62726:341-721(+)
MENMVLPVPAPALLEVEILLVVVVVLFLFREFLESRAVENKDEADCEEGTFNRQCLKEESGWLSSPPSFSQRHTLSSSWPTTLKPRGTGIGKAKVVAEMGDTMGACHGLLHIEHTAIAARFRNVHL